MRRKYFIRGLGLGIIITACLFIISMMFNNGTMSDAQIMAKAKELGMIMPDNTMQNENQNKTDSQSQSGAKTEIEKLQESLNNTESQSGESTSESVLNEGETTVENKTGEDVTPPPSTPGNPGNPGNTTGNTSNTGTAGNTGNTTGNGTGTNGGGTTGTSTNTVNTTSTVKFQIRSGESSYRVSENLKSAGLITDASAFDRYLEQNGYDVSIHTGTFEIKTGSSHESIAKIITGR